MRTRMYVAAIFLTLLPLFAIGAESEDSSPESCAAVVESIYRRLDSESIDTLKKTKREDVIKFHLSWGMGIRNSYGLWAEDSKIRKSCAQTTGAEDMHPESASTMIMELVWDRVNAGI